MPAKFFIGIDLGGTNLKVGLLNSHYRIIAKEILSTKKFLKKEGLIQAIADSVMDIAIKQGLSKKNISAIGLGLPGPIDTKAGIVHFFPNIPGWREVNLKAILQKKLSVPVFIDNDAKLMCLAEQRRGAAAGFNNVICLTLGTGVGGGIIIDGKLYRGRDNASGEIGHLPINEDGPFCNCGGRACLESYIGNNRILKHAKRLFKRNITLEELSALAKKKNKQALNIWNEVGGHLGVALAGVVNLLNPDCIVIGGGVANAGKLLIDKVKETIAKRAMSVQARGIKVFKAKLGSDAGIIGAAILAIEGTE